jgi:hypothetical protein
VRTDLLSLRAANSGWSNLFAKGINDSGQIIGFGTFDGETDGFLIDTELSTPEPGSSGLFCAAVIILVIIRKNPWNAPV